MCFLPRAQAPASLLTHVGCRLSDQAGTLPISVCTVGYALNCEPPSPESRGPSLLAHAALRALTTRGVQTSNRGAVLLTSVNSRIVRRASHPVNGCEQAVTSAHRAEQV